MLRSAAATSSTRNVAVLAGTGFNQQFLDLAPDNPLGDWRSLLRATAQELGVPGPWEHKHWESSAGLTLVWEELVVSMVSRGFILPGTKDRVGRFAMQAGQAETFAKKAAQKVLKASVPGRPKPNTPDIVLPVADFISLNFEAFWSSELARPDLEAKRRVAHRIRLASKSISPEREVRRLYFRQRTVDGMTLWFPNGHVSGPRDSLRLGLRDFGFHPKALHDAVNKTKAWELQTLGTDAGLTGDAAYHRLLAALSESNDAGPADHWVTPFLIRPLFILGTALSPAEQGIWWLLAQRHRNSARVNNPAPVYILLKANTMSDQDKVFWENRPLGVLPIWCETWEQGWAEVAEVMEKVSANFHGTITRGAGQ